MGERYSIEGGRMELLLGDSSSCGVLNAYGLWAVPVARVEADCDSAGYLQLSFFLPNREAIPMLTIKIGHCDRDRFFSYFAGACAMSSAHEGRDPSDHVDEEGLTPSE